MPTAFGRNSVFRPPGTNALGTKMSGMGLEHLYVDCIEIETSC